jgi:hypothetical protein
MSLAETLRRNANPNADRETPLGQHDHLAWVARHRAPLFCCGWGSPVNLGFEDLAQIAPADLYIPILGQLAPAQLPIDDEPLD